MNQPSTKPVIIMLMRKCGVSVDDDVIEAVLRYGEADIGKEYLDVIRQAAKECCRHHAPPARA